MFEGSITSVNLVEKAVRDVDAIVHLAARGSVPRSLKNPRATYEVNVEGTLNICEAARAQSIPVIFSSSSSVYGANTRDKKIENEWLSPLSPYAASKLSGEATIVSFARSFGIQTAAFRLFNVYGPGQRPEHQYSAVIPKWIWAALREEELKIFGDGETSRDFTYIENVVEILSRCVLEGRYFDGVTNLAFGNPVTLLDVIHEVRKLIPGIKVKHYQTRPGDIRNSDNGSQRLRELFPEVRPTSLQDGIDLTLKWLKSSRVEIEAHPLMVSDD
jgi:UDP-glucose 4-epimerase